MALLVHRSKLPHHKAPSLRGGRGGGEKGGERKGKGEKKKKKKKERARTNPGLNYPLKFDISTVRCHPHT